MKNIVIGILILIILLIVIGVIEEYGLIDWEWNQLAVAVAALAGPFQYVQNKLEEKREEKEEKERQYRYKRLEYEQYRRREQSRTGIGRQREEVPEEEATPAQIENEFNTETTTFG